MKGFTILLFILCYYNLAAQDSIEETEEDLTGGSSKTWVYLETIKTMGTRMSKVVRCRGEKLTFEISGKKYEGKVCEASGPDNSTWSIQEEAEDEQYITMDKRYMIDIYSKNVNGERKQVLRLKRTSDEKDTESIGHIYFAQ